MAKIAADNSSHDKPRKQNPEAVEKRRATIAAKHARHRAALAAIATERARLKTLPIEGVMQEIADKAHACMGLVVTTDRDKRERRYFKLKGGSLILHSALEGGLVPSIAGALTNFTPHWRLPCFVKGITDDRPGAEVAHHPTALAMYELHTRGQAVAMIAVDEDGHGYFTGHNLERFHHGIVDALRRHWKELQPHTWRGERDAPVLVEIQPKVEGIDEPARRPVPAPVDVTPKTCVHAWAPRSSGRGEWCRLCGAVRAEKGGAE